MASTTLWSSGDDQALLPLARRLEECGAWRAYLSPEEHAIFLNHLRSPEDWAKLICNKSTISSPVNVLNGTRNGFTSETPASSAYNDSSDVPIIDGIRQEAHPLSNGEDRPAQVDQLSVVRFRVRCMLYDHSLALLFPSKLSEDAIRQLDLPSLDKALPSMDATPLMQKQAGKRDENSDYDFEEDEEEDDEEGDNNDNNNSNNNNNNKNSAMNGDSMKNHSDSKRLEGGPDSTEVNSLDNNEIGNNGQTDTPNMALASVGTIPSITSGHIRKPPELEEDQETIELIKKNLSTIYYTLEEDAENMQEQAKDLKQSLPGRNNTSKLANVNLGAANLSLKHLLGEINIKRDELHITDMELRNLIMDVRKNRSKWASDERIGQEELYEAAEKVVIELRAYTPHSLPFLTKVSKREAPNYYNIITRPMDLGTISRKLKAFQYRSKREFVDDLMLIWENCRTYNTDLNHIIRQHANAMERKTQSLVALMPNITIRDRAEVEAEEASTMAENDDENDSELGEEVQSSRMSFGVSSKGPQRNEKGFRPSSRLADNDSHPDSLNSFRKDQSPVSTTRFSATPFGNNQEDDEYFTPLEAPTTDDNHKRISESVVTRIWRKTTRNKRARLCLERSQLFATPEGLLNTARAPMRTKHALSRFLEEEQKVFPDYTAIKRKEPTAHDSNAHKDGKADASSANIQKSDKQFDGTYNKELTNNGNIRPPTASNNDDNDEQDDLFLAGYETWAGVPSIEEGNETSAEVDQLTEDLVEEKVPPSKYLAPRPGLVDKIDQNLREMQQIRKICSKVALIRQMQQPFPMYGATLLNPEPLKETDVDLESRLPGRTEIAPNVCKAVLQRSVGKLAMHVGFEGSQMSAINALTGVAGEYLQNLGKALVLYKEKMTGSFKYSFEESILHCLRENGLQELNDLRAYVKDDIFRQGNKLADIHRRMKDMLSEMLKPALVEGAQEDASQTQFRDGSEQFVSGYFSEDVGEDFFGFRELGLDKELGLSSLSVPFHLLHSRLSHSGVQATTQMAIKVKENKFPHTQPIEPYPEVNAELAEKQIELLHPFFLEKLKEYGQPFIPSDEELPPRQKTTRPKIPPTGKTPVPRRKPIAKAFLRPSSIESQSSTKSHDEDLGVNSSPSHVMKSNVVVDKVH